MIRLKLLLWGIFFLLVWLFHLCLNIYMNIYIDVRSTFQIWCCRVCFKEGILHICTFAFYTFDFEIISCIQYIYVCMCFHMCVWKREKRERLLYVCVCKLALCVCVCVWDEVSETMTDSWPTVTAAAAWNRRCSARWLMPCKMTTWSACRPERASSARLLTLDTSRT